MSQSGGKQELPPVVTYDSRTGAPTFHVGAAAQAWGVQEQEAALLMQDLANQGVILPGTPAPGMVPPRGMVHVPTMPDMGVDRVRSGEVPKGVGDLHTQQTDPGQRYWETHDMPRAPEGRRAVARKRTPPRRPPGMTEDQARHYEEYMVDILDRVMRSHEERTKCGTYFVQPQAHLAPIPSAIPIDVFTDGGGVTITAGAAGVTVIQVNFPDRFFGIIDRFGFCLGDHVDYPTTTLSMQRNEAPLRSYGNFNIQLGGIKEPTPLGSPLLFGPNSQFRLVVVGSVNTIILARAQGWSWATKNQAADGSFKQFHND